MFYMRKFSVFLIAALLLVVLPGCGSITGGSMPGDDATPVGTSIEGISPEVLKQAKGFTKEAFFDAIEDGETELVAAMLQFGANPNWQGDFDDTPLEAAVEYEHPDIVRLLLDNGADVNLAAHFDMAPLMRAVEVFNFEIVEDLLAAGAYPNLEDGDGDPLIWAAIDRGESYQDYSIPLLMLGGDYHLVADVSTADGEPILAAALDKNDVYNCPEEIILLLIEKGATVNAEGNDGRYPLHLAVDRGSLTIVNALLKAGADPNKRNRANWTPFQYANTYKDNVPGYDRRIAEVLGAITAR
jgi:ankyrin repeat protein